MTDDTKKRSGGGSASREVQVMQQVVDILEPMTRPQRARVLLAAAMLSAPNSLTESQVLALWRSAQAKP